MLGIGDVVERYRVVSVLGEGGMALVYLVEHEKLATRHALKVLTIGNRDVQRRTLQEGKLQATLRHPNIVAVTDVLDIDGAPALLMEFIEGPPLDAWLDNYRPTLDEALDVFRGIVAGVKYAHDTGLIHRDLKPANVMLQPTPHGIVTKVTDFGLAKALGAEGSGMKKTRTGATMGTPAYMAPEQIRDASSVDRRADVYSLGCILYELVCGRPPYQAPDILTLFTLVGTGDYPAPESFVPNLPAQVGAAIRGALHADASRRFADCEALSNVLYAQPGQSLPGRAFGGGPTLFPDSPAAQAITMLAQERKATPTPHRSSGGETSGTWNDDVKSKADAARRSNRSADTVMAPVAAPQSITSLSNLSVPPAQSPWPLRIVSALAVVALGVGAAGLAGGLAIAFTSQTNAPAATPVDEAPAAAPVTPPPIDAPIAVIAPPVIAPPVVPEPVATVVAPPKTKVAPRVTVEPKPVPLPIVPEPPAIVVAPPAEPTAPAGAQFSFSGADRVVLLDGAGAEWAAGADVPPGTYQVRAWFPESETPVGAGKVTLGAGQIVTLKCNAAFAQCKK